jgi:outer membrane immunogenic protein
MTKILISSAAAIALLTTSLSAKAADVPAWAGFYVGANFGNSWAIAKSDFSSPITSTRSNSQDLRGAVGGGQIGYNWRTNAWVWGVEADFQGTDQKGTFFNRDTNPADLIAAVGPGVPGSLDSTLNQNMPWFGTVRARVGFVLEPRWMIYATGGLAYGEVDSNLSTIDPDNDVTTSSWSETHFGWTVGAGVEAAFWDNWTGRLEYLHMDLGRSGGSTNSTLFTTGPFLPAGGAVTGHLAIRTRLTDEILRVGLNYRF